jgi:hypothetical protein
VTVLRVRGYALPGGEPAGLYADGDRWTTDPVAGAELAAEGWLLPGLVDAHTHPGAEKPGQALDDGLLRDHLRALAAAGVPPQQALAAGSWTAGGRGRLRHRPAHRPHPARPPQGGHPARPPRPPGLNFLDGCAPPSPAQPALPRA